MTRGLGRHVFGLAALAFGLLWCVWHDARDWDQLRFVANARLGALSVDAAAAAQIVGGAAMQFGRTAKTGAGVVGALYLVFAVLDVPRIVAAPQIYDHWGNFFEQFSLFTGAAMVYAHVSPRWPAGARNQAGRILVGLCTVSFMLEQAFHLDATAALVPSWLPPNRMFWAVTTTIAFAGAAAALLANRLALLATRLLAIMIASFGVLVWVPLLLSHPRSRADWSETVETFAIAGVAWILADLLGENRTAGRRALT